MGNLRAVLTCKWLAKGPRVAPKYGLLNDQLVITNVDELKKDDITAEIITLTREILSSQKKVTLLNRQLKLLRVIPQKDK